MPEHDISAKLKQFIFEFVDSVELIEVLLFLRHHPDDWCSAIQISSELRSNPTSINKRLLRLEQLGMIVHGPSKDLFHFQPENAELQNTVSELAHEYELRRHTIFELIFSSSKNARQFADAFVVTREHKKDSKGDPSDG